MLTTAALQHEIKRIVAPHMSNWCQLDPLNNLMITNQKQTHQRKTTDEGNSCLQCEVEKPSQHWEDYL
jgi:hypothetical protein